MSYQRVIPRDLFNEANLLKCYGQLWLKLEVLNVPQIVLEHNDIGGWEFDIRQYDEDGSTYLYNVQLWVRGEPYPLHRPLNSREPWPLYLTLRDDTEIAVFTDEGELTLPMIQFLQGTTPCG